MTAPLCDCHGLPKWWQTDRRKKHGGYWVCWENKRALARRQYHSNPEPTRVRNARNFRRRYDYDPVWRIGRNLQRGREQRVAHLARRRQQLEED